MRTWSWVVIVGCAAAALLLVGLAITAASALQGALSWFGQDPDPAALTLSVQASAGLFLTFVGVGFGAFAAGFTAAHRRGTRWIDPPRKKSHDDYSRAD